MFAQFGKNLGSLIEAVNVLGSLFYGSLLGVFVLAFFFRRVHGTGAFWGMLAGEAALAKLGERPFQIGAVVEHKRGRARVEYR